MTFEFSMVDFPKINYKFINNISNFNRFNEFLSIMDLFNDLEAVIFEFSMVDNLNIKIVITCYNTLKFKEIFFTILK